MACVLYVIVIGTLLGIAGMLVERIMPPATTSRRWLWCAVIAINIIIPPIYRINHNSSITEVLKQQAGESGLAQSLAAASVSALDGGLTVWILALNPWIQRYWFFVSALLVFWGVFSALRIAFLVRRSRHPGGRTTPAVVDGLAVVVTDSIGPATVGVLRSRVVVPEWVLALPGIQRKYVLQHEEEHRKSRDSLLLFVASLPLLLMPWNLALWWQLRRLRLAVEMDCDNRVVSALGNPHAYGELLFKVAQAASRGPRLQPAFLGSAMLERRLTALLAPTQLRYAQRLLLPIVASLLLFMVLSMPHPVLSRPHSNDVVISGVTTAPNAHSHTSVSAR